MAKQNVVRDKHLKKPGFIYRKPTDRSFSSYLAHYNEPGDSMGRKYTLIKRELDLISNRNLLKRQVWKNLEEIKRSSTNNH